jgi:hypothetical protein
MKRTAVWTVVLGLLLAGLPLWAQYQGQYEPYPGQNAPYPGQNPNDRYGQNPNSGYGNYPGYGSNLIPEGTRFIVRLNDTLDTAKLKPGKKFTAKVAEDLVAPDGSTIPAGKKIHGHVSSINRGLHGSMLLSFDEIETQHGWRPLAATVTDVPGEHGTRAGGEEGEVQKKGTSRRRVAEGAVVGAAVGAAAGAVAAGPHGAIIGAAAGGALGGGAGILTDRDLKLNKGQQLELRLDRPLQVPR